MKSLVIVLAMFGVLAPVEDGNCQQGPLNILVFVADDLDRNSLGCYGSSVADISPNIDRFAQEGIRFKQAYVNNSICVPSRAILATGLYGHNSGVSGFVKMKDNSIPLLMELIKQHGHRVGVLSKVDHSTPKDTFQWDFVAGQRELGWGRSPTRYYETTVEFLESCKTSDEPFYLMVNSDDPHRPFFNPDEPLKNGAENPSRIYREDEIVIPGFLPDLPDVRTEVCHYYNSVKRLDDTFGKVLQALDDCGFKDNTLVIFLSDNGVAFPFAKCNTYYASNRTPWIARWPGGIKPNQVNSTNYISGVDFLPTVLDAIGVDVPRKIDGESRWPLYLGAQQETDNMVYTQIDNKATGKGSPLRYSAVPMRGIQRENHLYIYNAWSDGNRLYVNNNEGMSMAAMESAATYDADIKGRVSLFRNRVPEEFYDLTSDPNCLINLIDEPSYKQQVGELQKALAQKMEKHGDPLLSVYRNRYQSAHSREQLYRLYPEIKIVDSKME